MLFASAKVYEEDANDGVVAATAADLATAATSKKFAQYLVFNPELSMTFPLPVPATPGTFLVAQNALVIRAHD